MVSIVIPVYNVENYLEQCIESILAQTYEDYELLLIDDGSTDTSGEICDKYSAAYKMITAIHQKNSGVSAARNCGIESSNGDYITFIDSDDWVEPDYIERMVKQMSPGGFVAGGFVNDDNPTTESVISSKLSKSQAQKSVFTTNGIGGFVAGKLFDCHLLKEKNIRFCQDIAILEDGLFCTMYISMVTGSITVLEYAGYHYRTNDSGATFGRYGHNPPRQADFTEILALERAEAFLLDDREVYDAWRQRRDKAAVATLRTMISCDYTDEAEMSRLKKIIRRGCIKYVLGDVGCLSGKVSMILSAISPRLEWKIYKKLHTKPEEKNVSR